MMGGLVSSFSLHFKATKTQIHNGHHFVQRLGHFLVFLQSATDVTNIVDQTNMRSQRV